MNKLFGFGRVFLLFTLLYAPVVYAHEEAPTLKKTERIIEAFENDATIWYRNSRGLVGKYDIAKEKITKPFSEDRFVDLATGNGSLVGLKKYENSENPEQPYFELIDIMSGKTMSPKLELSKDSPLVLAVNDKRAYVVNRKSVSVFDISKSNNKWITKKLHTPLRHAPQMAAVVTSKGQIYFGRNKGEWGGGLRLITPETGSVSIIQAENPGDCGTLLYPKCDPVTSIISHPSEQGCVIAAMGLAHFTTRGAIITVCDGEIADVYRKAKTKTNKNGGQYTFELPFFDLVGTDGGWTAATYGQFVQYFDGKEIIMPYPEFANMQGIIYSRMDNGLIVIISDVNAGVSLSGTTPLLVRKIK